MNRATADQTQALDVLRRIEDALRTNKALLVVGDGELSIELLDWHNNVKFRLTKVENSNYVASDLGSHTPHPPPTETGESE